MIRNIKFLTTAVLVALSASVASATTEFGYCTDKLDRTNKFRLGTTLQQGTAIRLNHEKLALMKGAQIYGIDAVFGTRYTTDNKATIFISSSLSPDATPIASSVVEIPGAVQWCPFNFNEPYTITGDEEELYIGYYADITTSSTLLMSDFETDTKGCCYAYYDGEWVDLFGYGFGNSSVRAIIDGVKDFTDATIKPVNTQGYYLAGKEYKLGTQVFNFGSKEINSFDVQVKIGNESVVKSEYRDLKIAHGGVYDIALPDFTSLQQDYVNFDVEVVNVNGGSDDVPGDNVFKDKLFCYPANMERTILLEGFTGQECSNCPTGHQNIENFLPTSPLPVIEIMHHSGYYPDMFTMADDMDYTFFYSGSGYAPAMMMNRTTVPSIQNVPVMGTTSNNLTNAANYIATLQPYVSLVLDTKYDKDSRKLDITFRSFTHCDLPESVHAFNVVIYQNGLSAYQKPYSSYTHNKVSRGSLTGSAWGIEVPAEALLKGGRVEWTETITLPEAIFSDYWEDQLAEDKRGPYTWPTDPDNMYIVAYFGALGLTPSDCSVYNAVEVKLGESHTQGGWSGIQDVVSDSVNNGPEINVVDGQIVVNGGCDSLSAWTIDGRAVSTSGNLSNGIYIIRATVDGNTSVKKVIVK